MSVSITRRAATVLAAGALALGLSGGPAKAEEQYILATASTGGTYYPVGVAIATLVKVKLRGNPDVSAINSGGSADNVRLMREDEAQFAILQGLFGKFAAAGTGPFDALGPQDHFSSISMLWPNVEHFIVRSEHVDTGTVADFVALQGQRISLGSQSSGSRISGTTILTNLGVGDVDADYDLQFLGYGPGADALQNGQIEGFNPAAGDPVAAATRAFAAMGDDIALLEVTDEQIPQLNNGLNLWTRHVIPAGTYPGIDRDINTVAQPNFLAVNNGVSADHVYEITKTIYENLPFLNGIHAATKAMSLDVALNGLPVALHPGARRYYEEVGIAIPANLQ